MRRGRDIGEGLEDRDRSKGQGTGAINSQFVFHFWRDGIPDRIIESVEWKGSATEALPSRETSLLKDSSVSIASSTIPVYRPVLNGRSNAKWIQTAANRVLASYESACWKPPLDVIEFRLNAKRESENACMPAASWSNRSWKQFRASTWLIVSYKEVLKVSFC